MIFGYSRISKGTDQKHDIQLRSFDKADVERVFEETASGSKWDRPVLNELINQLRVGDIVVVWKLDRLSRSMKDTISILERIRNKGAYFKSMTEDIDTTSAAGTMMMHMLSAFAQFERDMIRERTKAGLEAARAEGRIGGRAPKLDFNQQKDIYDNVITGRKTGADMARLYKVHESTISRIVARIKNNVI